MSTFSRLIDRWQTVAAFADEIGVAYVTAHAMKTRDSINARHWPAVMAAARKHGWDDVTLESLVEMSRRRGVRRRRPPLAEAGAAA